MKVERNSPTVMDTTSELIGLSDVISIVHGRNVFGYCDGRCSSRHGSGALLNMYYHVSTRLVVMVGAHLCMDGGFPRSSA